MLADFSLACPSLPQPESESQVFGGTLSYMAPEHLDAFLTRDRAAAKRSMSVRIFIRWDRAVRILDGPITPFRRQRRVRAEKIASLAAERRSRVPSPRLENPKCPRCLIG